MKGLAFAVLLSGVFCLLPQAPAYAQTRNASFVNPASAARPAEGAKAGQLPTNMAADPAEVDAGETLVNVARRITVFFYNGFRSPVQINDLTLNADGNVRSKVVADDCKALKKLPPSDRCSVAVEVIPSSPGPWTVELLLNHSGQGRISRAEVIGSTLGKADEKSEGLAISKKIAPNLDFGTVRAGEGKAARTMLIENDSNEPLIISSIDLISENGLGLTLRDTGCKKDDKLKPGKSCPITLMWEPRTRGTLSTDLIVRHNGNLGFVVVPIRGAATIPDEKDGEGQMADSASPRKNYTREGGDTSSLMPRSAPSLGNLPMPSVSDIASSLPPMKMPSSGSSGPPGEKNAQGAQTGELPPLKLIGTVGGRAILGGPSQETIVIGLGETTQIDGFNVELLQLDAMRAVISINGTRQELSLRNAPSYMQGRSGGGGGMGNEGGGSQKGSGSSGPPPNKVETPAAASTPTSDPPKTSTGPGGTTSGVQVPPIDAKQLMSLVN